MKSKIAILAATFACLTQGADSVRAQQAYPSGGYPYSVPGPYAAPGMTPGMGTTTVSAALPGYAAPAPVHYVPAATTAASTPAEYTFPTALAPAGVVGAGVTPVPVQSSAPGVAPVPVQSFAPGVAPVPVQSFAPGTAVPGVPQAVYSTAPTTTGVVPGPAAGTSSWPSVMADGSAVMPDSMSPVTTYAGPMPGPETAQAGTPGLGLWQGACTGGDNCTSCDSCDGCGHRQCNCACRLFGGRLANLFRCRGGQGGGLCRLGQLHRQWANNPRPVRVWGGVEALWWWNKERELPVLATTSVAGTPFAEAGVLGAPGTRTLFGGNEFDGEASEGIRGTLGLWLDRGQNVGVFARAFQFGEEEIDFRRSSAGNPILAQPFFDVGLGIQDALVVAFPGLSRGRIDIQTGNEVRGYDLLLRKLLYYGECNRLDLIGGYHATEIEDAVFVGHEIISTDPQGRVPVGTQINTLDAFEAENEYHGGSIGIMAQGFDGRLTWNLLSKISFGNNRQTMSIAGTSTTFVPGAGSATFDDGFLALGTNSGIYERDQFCFVPELDLSVMYNVCSMLSVSVGYSVIYWSDVVLAQDAVNTSINPTQIGGPLIGPARPIYSLVDDDFWLHGLTFGVHGRF